MKPPIFFLCFANNENQSILALEKESESIYRLLSPFADQQRIQIHKESFATINKIVHYLTQFKDRIGVFHFAGHARAQNILLHNKNIHAAGLAYQLAKQNKLQLVFLNACSTRKQVELLLELGVPTVIATSSNIDDNLAVDFSTQFYSAISASLTIKEAFESASALVVAATNERPRIIRAAELRENSEQEIPWGLYTISEKHLNKKLIEIKEKERHNKNIFLDSEAEAIGTIKIGDKKMARGYNIEDYGDKNIVKNSKIKSGGSIQIGDG